ncbi:MAG: FAD-dependent monooxygenase [Neomegalonema sp.]|nr:FAD-dependent monooxygenase [Neomegalonema sp.]
MTDRAAPDIRTEVAILGGGLVGAALALALAKREIDVTVCDGLPLEHQLDDEFDGRAYAVALSSRRFLGHLGLWEQLAPNAQEIRDILVSDGRPGERASELNLHFDADEMGPAGYGHMVEDRFVRRALLEAARAAPGVRYLDSAPAELEDPDRTVGRVRPTEIRPVLRLADGRRIEADLVVGCDGRRSRVAEAIGAVRIRGDYDQIGLVCAIEHQKPHGGVAHELFLPSGPFAILPLTGNRCSLVWTERTAMARSYEHASDALYLSEIKRRIGGILGEISLAGKRWQYPLNTTVADRFVAPRVALVGDAARGMHPIAGQGANYGWRDAAALAEVVGDAAQRGEDIGALDVLRRYERWRRPDSLAISLATDGLNRLFSNDIGPVRWARRLGLAGFGKIGPLRRAAMKLAAGDLEHLPRSMRG